MAELREPVTDSPRPKPGLYTLNADGGMVGGQAAIGAILKDADNSLVEAISTTIEGAQDQNVAEFRALIEGLKLLKPQHLRDLLTEARALFEQFTDRKLC